MRLPVYPNESKPGGCKNCRGGTRDLYGDHSVMCGGGKGAQANARHNAIARLIVQAAVYAGFKAEQIKTEHHGGLDDGRPGDVAILNYKDGRTLLIDVCVVNPLATSYRHLF